jgi:chromosome segregation ATPase
MARSFKALAVLLVAVVGLWGCSQGTSSSSPANAERVRTLESKCAKLEEDYRGAVATRDQLRKEVGGLLEERAKLEQAKARLEVTRGKLEKDLEAAHAVAVERDQLRKDIESRTTERDTLQLRCDRLKKGLQNLLGQDDAMSQPQQGPSVPVLSSSPGGQS